MERGERGRIYREDGGDENANEAHVNDQEASAEGFPNDSNSRSWTRVYTDEAGNKRELTHIEFEFDTPYYGPSEEDIRDFKEWAAQASARETERREQEAERVRKAKEAKRQRQGYR